MDLTQFDNITQGDWHVSGLIMQPKHRPHCNVTNSTQKIIIAKIEATHELQHEQAANALAISQLPNILGFANKLQRKQSQVLKELKQRLKLLKQDSKAYSKDIETLKDTGLRELAKSDKRAVDGQIKGITYAINLLEE